MRRKFFLFFLLIISIVFFLVNKENWIDNVKYIFAGWIVFCAGLFFFAPSGKSTRKVRRKVSESSSEALKNDKIESIELDEMENDLPEPITMQNQDATTLRELKLAKIANKKALAQSQIDENMEVELDLEEEIEVVEVIEEVDEYHVANEYVVDVNADSIEDIEIVNAVGERRSVHDRIRKRIEERRRNQMAEIRASKARMWNA